MADPGSHDATHRSSQSPLLRTVALVGTAIVCAALAWRLSSAALALSLAGVIAAASMAVGVRRQWVGASVVDPFAPYCFPLAFVALSSLYPAWLILYDHVALMGFPLESYGTHTAGLVAASVIGVAIGIHLPRRSWAPRSDEVPEQAPEHDVQVATLLRLAGRSLTTVLVLVGVGTAVLAGPQSRGMNQSTYQVSDSVKAAALILALPAVLLILLARQHLPPTRVATVVDWSLIGALIVGSSLTGDRATAITVMLCAAFYFTRQRQSVGKMLAPFAAIALFAVVVLAYRQWAVHATEADGPFRAIATDLSPASYTLGLVSGRVPSQVGYRFGLTYGDALVHQLPSVITVPLMGPSENSGSMVFRDQILHMTDPNSGYGFSAPAEAYLNFGVVGVLVVGLGIGWLFGWAYSRRSWPSLRTSSFIYICLVAPLPFAYRSDALGAIKGSLYPIVLLALSLLVARRIARSPHPAWLRGILGPRPDDHRVRRAEALPGALRAYQQDQGDGGR